MAADLDRRAFLVGAAAAAVAPSGIPDGIYFNPYSGSLISAPAMMLAEQCERFYWLGPNGLYVQYGDTITNLVEDTCVATHDLKSWPDFFAPILDGSKTFDVRNNDRRFLKGDMIRYSEFDDRKGVYTGRECWRVITYIISGVGPGGIPPLHGIRNGFVVLALKPVDRPEITTGNPAGGEVEKTNAA